MKKRTKIQSIFIFSFTILILVIILWLFNIFFQKEELHETEGTIHTVEKINQGFPDNKAIVNNNGQASDIQNGNHENNPKTTELELDKLVRLAHSDDKIAREKAVGELLFLIKPGMTREEVEKWLGLPCNVFKDVYMPDSIVAQYDCRPPQYKTGPKVMTIHYKKDGTVYRFFTVRGPHTPDS